MGEYPLDEVIAAAGGRVLDVNGVPLAADFGDPRAEYDTAAGAAAICDRRDRGLIEIAGKDRAAWLHNLVTNAVKTLQPGEGNYAFAINAKGRILFDGNILVRPDVIWLDIDRRLVAKAMAHMERYHVVEDVTLTDRSSEFCRVGLLGPRAAEIAGALGATHAGRLPEVGTAQVVLEDRPRLAVRTDFAGVFGLELFVESADAAACWRRLLELGGPGLRPVGRSALEVLRIEAGIPVYDQDIDEDILPGETMQTERAVSFVKGCYLGQEVVERMRSRGSLARRLAGLRFGGGGQVQPGAALQLDGANVGRVTSVCESYAVGRLIGLGYVKTAHAEPGTHFAVEGAAGVVAEVHPLPFRG